MNTIGEIIKPSEITKGCREINPKDIILIFQGDRNVFRNVFWSWGAHNFMVDRMKSPRMFRMLVNGNHHKGHVYIFLNGLDLFDVYYTSNRGTIKKISKDLYFDMLVNDIDTTIEKIPAYQY